MDFVSLVKRVLVTQSTPLVESIVSDPLSVLLSTSLILIASYSFLKIFKNPDRVLDTNSYTVLSGFIISLGVLAAYASSLGSSVSVTGFLLYSLTIFSATTMLKLGSIMPGMIDEKWFVFSTGLAWLLLSVSIFSPRSLYAVVLSGAVGLISTAILYALLKTTGSELLKPVYFIPLAAHYLDAATTFVAIEFFGGSEIRFLGSLMIEHFGTPGIFVLKTLIVLPVIYYIYQEIDLPEVRELLFLISVIGFSIAVRNTFLAA